MEKKAFTLGNLSSNAKRVEKKADQLAAASSNRGD
jgi:hypothetical protein